jgi:O-antigen/teichoic acid export membrane protein
MTTGGATAAAARERPLRRGRSRLRAVSGGSATLLTAGTIASGVLAYGFNVVAARALGPAAYGPVAVLWAGMFLISVVLFRPVEQTLSRGIAERRARGQDARPVFRSVGYVMIAAAALSGLAMLVAWGPLSQRLFAGQEGLTIALAAGVAGYGVSYFVRGVASGLLWFDGYGVLLLADGAVRLLLALPLFIVASTSVAAIAIAAAALAGALAPLLMRDWRRGSGDEGPMLARLAGEPAPPFAVGHALAFAAPAALIAAADQVLVAGGPLLVALAGGPGAAAAAGTVFAATMLLRAPVFLFQGLAASLLPKLTRFQATGDLRGFRRHLFTTCGMLLALGVALTAGALAAGPEAMTLMFGDGFGVDRVDLALLSGGVGLYLTGATLSQAALARDLTGHAAAIWCGAAATFVALELTLSGSPFHRVSLAFAAAALLMAALFTPLIARNGGINAQH